MMGEFVVVMASQDAVVLLLANQFSHTHYLPPSGIYIIT